ncbi:universal stress protein [Govanella unica]|uniref:Universal stress protein n=1 Tax=Govanella unica TaxID=2975056 RepID=A0A9X3TZX3_9PROT|nr:universal stress protein [Govania unica]MDA5194678.1 universal stress protein [Govania unica]
MLLDKKVGPRVELGPGEHQWKFLVVADDTPEFHQALRYASRRAAKISGSVVLLYVIPPADFQHWSAIEHLMREEAQEAAQMLLDRLADDVRSLVGFMPEIVIRQGKIHDEILAEINEDGDIHALVLGAANAENPGPLVSAFGGPLLRGLRIPVLFVPGGLSAEDIDLLV